MGAWAAVAGNMNRSERLETSQALELYTINAAKATGEDKTAGSIRVGNFADLVVLDRDPLSADPESLKDIRVVMTIRRGRVIYVANP